MLVQRRRTAACVQRRLCLGDHGAAYLPPLLPLSSAWACQLSGAQRPGSPGSGDKEGEVCVEEGGRA